MDSLYRTVEELPETAIIDLKIRLYHAVWNMVFNGWDTYRGEELSENDIKTIVNVDNIGDVPDDVVYRAYAGYSFVPEDFTCGAGDNWDLLI